MKEYGLYPKPLRDLAIPAHHSWFLFELLQNHRNAVWRDPLETSGPASFLVVPFWGWEYPRVQGSL